MSRVYFVVDAGEVSVGTEGYAGDSLKTVKEKKIKRVITDILEESCEYRFRTRNGDRPDDFLYFQPIERDGMEKALEILGKKMKRKDDDYYKIFTEAFKECDGTVFLSSGSKCGVSLQTVLEEFEIVE